MIVPAELFHGRSTYGLPGVGIYRHEEKTDPSGPLTKRGWERAIQAGEQLGLQAENSGVHIIQVESGTVPRTVQTAQAVELGVQFVQRASRRHASVPKVYRSSPRNDLSLSAIADGPESVFVQKYKAAIEAVETALDSFPFFVKLFAAKEYTEQAAVGKVLLEWLRMDNKRPITADGTADPHTRSAREVAQLQAFFLKQNLNEVIADAKMGKPTQILKYSHENMVLIWARYFLYQERKSRRRGQPARRISGMEIVEKIGGKIPYLGGVHIHVFPDDAGEFHLRARFNNAWYEVDMDMIEALAQEQTPDPFLNEEYATSSSLLIRSSHIRARLKKDKRQELYRDRGLVA